MSAAAWRWCAVAGLATLGLSVALGQLPGLEPCGPARSTDAMIALELVRSPGDVAALFGAEPCTGRLVAAYRRALWLDLLAFVPAYLLFLLSAVAALRHSNLGLALVAFNLVMLAGALDGIENAILFKLMGEMPGSERSFTGLFWTARPKFALLALSELVLAAMLWRGTLLAKLGAGVMAAGGVVALITLIRAPHDPAMVKGHAAAWGALLVVGALGAVRPGLLGLGREVSPAGS